MCVRITAEDVKRLREQTGAGVMECKRALERSGGDFEKAAQILRAEGLTKAEKKMGRTASEGLIECYIHTGGRLAAMVELNCESDFVARTPEFKKLAHDIAMQVAAMSPQYISRAEVHEEVIERERRAYLAHAESEGKSKEEAEKIIESRLHRFFQETCLLEQPWTQDETKTIGELIKEKIAQFGENIVVRRFVRFSIGTPPLLSSRDEEPA